MSMIRHRPEVAVMRALFVPVTQQMRQTVAAHQYDKADLVRRTTEEWRAYVEQLDRAAAHLED